MQMEVFAPKYNCAAFGSAYMGSVGYYAAMLAAKRCVIDAGQQGLPHLWAHNHCRVCGANGVQQLVVPIDKKAYNARTPMRDIVVSDHGDWRHLHWGALFSAYGKSPFFDYIAIDLEKVIKGNQKFLLDLNIELHQLIVDFLDLPIDWAVSDSIKEIDLDLRGKVGEKGADRVAIAQEQYYQLWASRHGFQPNMSVLDILCNTGRESIFTLLKMGAGL